MRSLIWLLLSTFSIVSAIVLQHDRSRHVSTQLPSLIDADLEDLATGLENGHFTSVDLVNAYVARIKEVNGTLHAVTELNPDALDIAASLDAMRKNGTKLSPLHGIPILIKNNIATDDKMNNTAGSWALLGAKVPRDSTLAAKLRKLALLYSERRI